MKVMTIVAALLAMSVFAVAAPPEKPQNPAEVEGFSGVLEGDVKVVDPNGRWFTMSVAKAGADKASASDSHALVGKDVVVSIRWVDGTKPDPEQQKAVKSLKKGESVSVGVKAASKKALRMSSLPEKQNDA